MPTAQQVKACCAAAYQGDAVALILGPSYHPGGLALTRRLADTLRLRPGERILDVAAGTGATARLLATEYGARVDGIDLGAEQLADATRTTERAGLTEHVRFHLGDAETIPMPDASFDAVVCECAFCTFPDKPTAAAELARVLKPGGRVGITDVTVTAGGLPPSLSGLAGWVACLADARPVEQYAGFLADAGLAIGNSENHDDALAAMVERIDARLRTFRMLPIPELSDVDFDRALALTAQARRAVTDRIAGYALLTARKPVA